MLRSYHVIITVNTPSGYETREFDIEAEYSSEAIAEAKRRTYPLKVIEADWYYNN